MKKRSIKCNGPLNNRIRAFVTVMMVFMLSFTVKSGSADTAGAETDGSNNIVQEAPASGENDSLDDVSFPTFNNTGLDVCTNDDGKPLILLFSSPSCSHCEWVGEIFDFIVKYYMAGGLIEAHHYESATGDDLLTEEIETEIPPEYLQIKTHGDPKGLVPYFNFSCKYERVGNGYEKVDDPVAEATEIRQVIDTLIQMLSNGD